MQNAGIAELQLNWRYLAFDVHPDELGEAILGAKIMKFVGLNLTVPHKLMALQHVDVVDEAARQWGAINTIRFEGQDRTGAWQPVAELPPETIQKIRSVGFNTDADAIIRSLREDLKLEPRGASILLLGAGGAGQAAALRLAQEGAAQLHLVNRTQSKAEELAGLIGRSYPGVRVAAAYPKARVDLVLNATSLGLKPEDALPFDPARFDLSSASAVYDMIYRPAESPLLATARKIGCQTANGLGMLLYQGAKALEIWTGSSPPIAAMRKALEQNVYGR